MTTGAEVHRDDYENFGLFQIYEARPIWNEQITKYYHKNQNPTASKNHTFWVTFSLTFYIKKIQKRASMKHKKKKKTQASENNGNFCRSEGL